MYSSSDFKYLFIPMEKSMLLDELFPLRKADKAEREQLLAKLDRMTEQLLFLNESSQAQPG